MPERGLAFPSVGLLLMPCNLPDPVRYPLRLIAADSCRGQGEEVVGVLLNERLKDLDHLIRAGRGWEQGVPISFGEYLAKLGNRCFSVLPCVSPLPDKVPLLLKNSREKNTIMVTWDAPRCVKGRLDLGLQGSVAEHNVQASSPSSWLEV